MVGLEEDFGFGGTNFQKNNNNNNKNNREDQRIAPPTTKLLISLSSLIPVPRDREVGAGSTIPDRAAP